MVYCDSKIKSIITVYSFFLIYKNMIWVVKDIVFYIFTTQIKKKIYKDMLKSVYNKKFQTLTKHQP